MDGFETIFAFQLGNAAQLCKKVKELVFGVTLYEHCALTGSDGFALVLRGGDEVAALGRGGGSLGYGGLISSLAIEFDTWANDDMGDVAYNHVAVQAGGPGRPVGAEKEKTLAVTALSPHLYPQGLTDGHAHVLATATSSFSSTS